MGAQPGIRPSPTPASVGQRRLKRLCFRCVPLCPQHCAGRFPSDWKSSPIGRHGGDLHSAGKEMGTWRGLGTLVRLPRRWQEEDWNLAHWPLQAMTAASYGALPREEGQGGH